MGERATTEMVERKPSNEQVYYDALKRIARGYQTTDQLRRGSEKEYGLDFEEALEYAYDNIQHLASAAIRGKRRPKQSLLPPLFPRNSHDA